MLRQLPVIENSLLFYDPGSGEAVFFKMGKDGNLQTMNQYAGWGENLTFAPGEFLGDMHSDLFVYNRNNGTGYFMEIDGDGVVVRSTLPFSIEGAWDTILAGKFSNSERQDLFFYNSSSNQSAFYSVDNQGELILLKRHTNLDPSWDLVISGHFFEEDFDTIFGYNRQDNSGQFINTDGAGSFDPAYSSPGWTLTWDLIVPADFNRDGVCFMNAPVSLSRSLRGFTLIHCKIGSIGGCLDLYDIGLLLFFSVPFTPQ